jgi:hypothetical protein
MKGPGSKTIHYVDYSGNCKIGWVVGHNANDTAEITYLTQAGAVNAAHGVRYSTRGATVDLVPLTWHEECRNE